MAQEYLLEMKHITKDYYGTRVLEDVSLSLKKGEILALLGENGAGKSTLMNILFGMNVIHSTGGFQGEVLLDGEPIHITRPSQASELGIGMVHQEFMLIDGYEIAENIRLNREITHGNVLSKLLGKRLEIVDKEAMRKESRRTMDMLGLDSLDETVKVEDLSVGQKQFVEIARELNKANLKLVVLDEPTAVLTEGEAEQFLKSVRAVADQGLSFIFISHRLQEVVDYADTVVVLRDGKLVEQSGIGEVDTIRLSEMMVGRKVEILRKAETIHGEGSPADSADRDALFSLKDFYVQMPGERVRGISLDIRKGEILGIGGLAGHGKVGVANGIMGLYPTKGSVTYQGKPLDVGNTLETLRHKIAFVSEDRRGVGIILDESIEHNMCIPAMRVSNRFTRKIGPVSFYDGKEAAAYAQKMIHEIDIRCTGRNQPCVRLSGGNQQKVSIAKALAMNPEVIFISEPTRGIDIGAKKLILDYLVKLNTELGVTIVITSSELAELRSVCDRIAIVTEGRLAGVLNSGDEEYKFGLLMSGAEPATGRRCSIQ